MRFTGFPRRLPWLNVRALASMLAFAPFFLGATCDSKLAAEVQATTAVQVTDATITQCPGGGLVVRTFLDSDHNGAHSEGEAILDTRVLCNGRSAGIEVASAPSGTCPAGGQVFTTYIDTNNDGVRSTSESVTSRSTLCNGANGESARLTVTSASAGQCPAGGSVYSASVGTSPPAITIVCNGASAHHQMGVVGEPVRGRAYTTCHHDYLYFPGEGEGEGWLIFRHQQNGEGDGGAGATGFDLWNVNVSDFELASEDGRTTYCELHWDPHARVLTYRVIDASDGWLGAEGKIAL